MGKSEQELMAKRNQLMERDLEQIDQVKFYGVDLGTKRKIDLTFWAPSEEHCKAFVEACKRNELVPSLVLGPANSSELNQRWLVRCSIDTTITDVSTKENVVTFLLFADKFDCEYDGWGTAIVEVAKRN